MFNSRNLISMAVAAALALLAAGCDKAPETEGDGPKMEFVRIPVGSFDLGWLASEKYGDDGKGAIREVHIRKLFYMGKCEVTQAQWKAVMGTTLSQQRDKAVIAWTLKGEGPEYPMYYVSWEEAMEFCRRLGKKFRLPTELEWEYACRAGSKTFFYYGDDPNCTEFGEYAWDWDNSDHQTHPVGQKKPNAWGLHDMYGNVREWCSDREDNILSLGERGVEDPTGLASVKDPYHVFRGGSWLDKPGEGAEERGGRKGYFSDDVIGFRVVYTGRGEGDKQVLEIALPEKATLVASPSQEESESRPCAIAGVVRDETGLRIGNVSIRIIPTGGWVLRDYGEGWFEISWLPSNPNAHSQEYHLFAQNKELNLAVSMEIQKDINALDVRLKPGVILVGKVVDPDGRGIEKASVIIGLQTSDWSEKFLTWVEADADGTFEFKALPPRYDYVLSARKLHYGVGQAEVRSEDVRDNRVQGISVVLPRGEFSVSGVVVDADGKPVPNVWVYCTGRGQAGINSSTDAEGHFKADGIFKGQVKIVAGIQGNDGKWLGGSVGVEAGATDVRVVLGTGGAAPPPKGRACFPADTQVWAEGKLMPISQVAEGQTVGKLCPAATATAVAPVEKIEQHVGAFDCQDIVFENGNCISVVGAHCFMLDSGQWIAAQDLRNGLRLKTFDGTVTIRSVTTRAMLFVGKVYNLKMENSDRYIVGVDGIIVRDY